MDLDLKVAYLLLGSNLGERERYLEDALKSINQKVGRVFATSAIYETAAWGKTDQPAFLNLAIGIETHLTALELLHNVLDIEKCLGRVRHEKWGARLIDIDIIFYGDEIVNQGNTLIIPHPEMHHRKFVLEPLNEIAARYEHPVLKKSVSEILTSLTDSLTVEKR
ncbi:MAG: 2-amino-4-hydroxy-6-hydroxymethyldihydropteridine diphosphokinase [Flavobacterium sp.]|nr:MAG: 2-amino-4-hydroxy-6-hydroxymethyldihydropteridine diphosphokinase [Flavobacterium sp.]